MLLPVLGGSLESCLADLWVEPSGGPDGEPVLRYFDHVLPLWPGTARLPMRGLLESQHYRLTSWRDAATELNWRRFFDIATLIGIRVEDPAVFDATHQVIVGLVAEGLVDGLRVDHPDGLADPRGYLDRLASATGGAWVAVEKILAADEALPSDWSCAGTTGYDALRVVDGLFLDPAGGDALSAEYARLCRGVDDDYPAMRFADVAALAKREIANGSLAAEVTRLTRLLTSLSPDVSEDDTRTVLTEVLAAFPVYRAYVHPGEFPAQAAKAEIWRAVEGARRALPKRLRGLAADLGAAALGKLRPVSGAAGRVGEFAVRFQQTTGPVQAKGVEDTACYRWSRLISLNEVGCDPDRFGVTPDEFHAVAGRLATDWPATMTTLSTHDTKRQEDVRARLAVLAEIAARVGQAGQAVAQGGHRRRPGHGVPGVADRGGGVADQRRPAGWLPDEGRPRGQAADLVGRAGPGVRGGGACPGRPRARRSGTRGVYREFRRGDRGRCGRQLAWREARPAHHAGGARCLPGMRDGGAVPGRPGQPAGSGLHAHLP